MGLYDYINGEQVKCFYRPIFSPDAGIWHSGGQMIDYLNGDEVPIKTMYYKYPENFIILDYKKYENNCYIHIIKNKKIFKSCDLNNISNEDFKDNSLVVDYYGTNILNINSISDIFNYISNVKSLDNLIKDLNKDADDAHDIFFECFKLMQNFNKIDNSTDMFDLISEDNFKFIKSTLSSKNINSISEFKNKKEKYDTDSLEELKHLCYKAVKREFHKLNKEYEVKKNLSNQLIKPYKDKHKQTWYLKDTYVLEKEFGEYLQCIIYLFQTKNQDSTIFNNMERYIACKEKFIEFIERNPGIKDKYIIWNELNKEEIKQLNDTLESVLENSF